MFDLVNDPNELHNLYNAPAQQKTVANLDSGKAGQYTLQVDGERRVYQRVDPADDAPPSLEGYAGQYRSDELAMNWEVQVQAGGLVLQHRRHGEIPPHSTGRDRFAASILGSLQFERDSSGKITGFRVTTGRVRNLRFDRSDR